MALDVDTTLRFLHLYALKVIIYSRCIFIFCHNHLHSCRRARFASHSSYSISIAAIIGIIGRNYSRYGPFEILCKNRTITGSITLIAPLLRFISYSHFTALLGTLCIEHP